MTRPDHAGVAKLFLSAGGAAGCLFGYVLLLDWTDLHCGQDLLQLGEDFVAVDRLNAVFDAVSGGAHAEDVFVAGPILVAVVVLRFSLRHGTGGKVGRRLHVGGSDLHFFGGHGPAVDIVRINEGEVPALLLGDVPIDVHVEESGREVGAGIRTAGQFDGRDTDFASAFFNVNVNRNVSEQECGHFAFVDKSGRE